jgi:hypothetical protein
MNAVHEISKVATVAKQEPDDLLILAASWEQRCLGLPQKLADYRCSHVLMTIYDGHSKKREENIKKLRKILPKVGRLKELEAKHSSPIENVRKTIEFIRKLKLQRTPRITLDASSFTRKHLLQLLQGLDMANLLGDCHIYHTEPQDYHTQDNESMSEGISSIKTIETFGGEIRPSRDSLLILFLGFEGRRALAFLENLEPNRTIAVIADPPYRMDWKGRAEAQHRYLLSCLATGALFRSHSLLPASTEELLQTIAKDPAFSPAKYNYFVGPMGTKAQVVGLYRYWRQHRGALTVVYASPVRYKEERADFPPGRTWLVDRTQDWPTVGKGTR